MDNRRPTSIFMYAGCAVELQKQSKRKMAIATIVAVKIGKKL